MIHGEVSATGSTDPISLTRDVQRRTILKTGVLGTLVLGVPGAFALSGCASDKPSTAEGIGLKGITATPRSQTVVIDQSPFTAFDSYNPYIPGGYDGAGGLAQICFEYLWYMNLATGKMQPWLATDFKYNSDFTQITISLNPEAKWNDGKSFTSADVQFTLDLLTKHPTLLGGTQITAPISSMSTPDDHTIVIGLKSSQPRYHYPFICVDYAGQFILPKHIWSSQDPTTFKFNPPIGTGPYKLNKASRTQSLYIWEKDPNYWNSKVLDVGPKYVVYRTAPALDSAIQQYKQGLTDEAPVNGPAYQLVTTLARRGFKNSGMTTLIDPGAKAFLINTMSKGILNDHRMRWVISALTNREKMATTLSVPPTTPAKYPWPDFAASKAWEDSGIADRYPTTYDPAKAQSLLDEMGATKGSDGRRSYQGKPISLEIITGYPNPDITYLLAQTLAEDLNKEGIDATVKSLSASVYNDRVTKKQYDIRSEWIVGGVFDPTGTYTQFVKGAFPISDPKLDSAVDAILAASPTASNIKDLEDAALEEWFKQMPAVVSIQTLYAHPFSTAYWTGWPTKDNSYNPPNHWWGNFIFVLGELKPTGRT